MNVDGDFEIGEDEEEQNKEFNKAYEQLRNRNKDEFFFLTENEAFIEH